MSRSTSCHRSVQRKAVAPEESQISRELSHEYQRQRELERELASLYHSLQARVCHLVPVSVGYTISHARVTACRALYVFCSHASAMLFPRAHTSAIAFFGVVSA